MFRHLLSTASLAFTLGTVLGVADALLHLDPIPEPAAAVVVAVVWSALVYGVVFACGGLALAAPVLALRRGRVLRDPAAGRRAGVGVAAILSAALVFVDLGMWYYQDAPFTTSLAETLRRADVVVLALASLAAGAALSTGAWWLGLLSRPVTRAAGIVALVGAAGWVVAIAVPAPHPAAGARPLPRARVALMGIDAASWNVLLPWLGQGRLPNLRALMDDGVWGVLRSRHPTRSPALWTTIATGMKRSKHGIDDFLVTENGQRVPTGSTHRRTKALWNILTEAGRSAWVIDWMATYPPEPIEGAMITNLLYRDEGPAAGRPASVHPSALGPVIERLVAPYRAAPVHYPNATLTDDQYEELERKYQSDVAVLEQAALYACRQPWDVLALYTHSTDAVLHHFWKFMEPARFADPVYGLTPANVARFGDTVARQFERVDAMLGRLLVCLGEDTVVMVVSDHGQQARVHRPATEDDLTSGHHQNDGILVMRGPHVRRGIVLTQRTVDTPAIELGKMINDRLLPIDVDRALRSAGVLDYLDLADVTPTVLHLVGLPVADDMDGRVVTRALEPGYLVESPVRHVATYEGGAPVVRRPGASVLSPEREQELRALGYIR